MKKSIDDNLSDPIAQMERVPMLAALMAELKSGILLFWEAADQILRQCGVSLKAPTEATFSLQKNFFSLLFLYSYQRAGIARSRRILYAATLQCLRGMVTGCDNLLDDEYKQTFDTDIPATGYRFRSVMDIMAFRPSALPDSHGCGQSAGDRQRSGSGGRDGIHEDDDPKRCGGGRGGSGHYSHLET